METAFTPAMERNKTLWFYGFYIIPGTGGEVVSGEVLGLCGAVPPVDPLAGLHGRIFRGRLIWWG